MKPTTGHCDIAAENTAQLLQVLVWNR